MSDTPRTDREVIYCQQTDPLAEGLYVSPEFARELERENAALLNAIKNIALLTANGDAERANWVAIGILNNPHVNIDAAREAKS